MILFPLQMFCSFLRREKQFCKLHILERNSRQTTTEIEEREGGGGRVTLVQI